MVINKQSGKNTSVEVASGIDALISRLRDEGVQNGRRQAEQIVSDARDEAETMIKQARQEADQIVGKARAEAENLTRAGKEALELAFRDTVLALKTQLAQKFATRLQNLVCDEEQREALLERMILEVAGGVKEKVAQSQEVEILLPGKAVGFEELSRNPEEMEKGILTQFVRLTISGMLRDGVSFGVAKDTRAGLQIRLVDSGVVLDLSDRAVAEAILEHLQPRFMLILKGSLSRL